MSIYRSRIAFEDHFTQLPNAWMRDPRLSRRARGLLAELMTHREGWVVSVASLTRGGPEGRDAIMKALQELESHGYLQRKQTKVDGRFASTDYVITDPGPWSENPTTENPTSGNPSSENPHPKKTRVKKTSSQNTKTKTSADADAPVAGDAEADVEVIEDPAPWDIIAKRAYDSTDGALPYMGMRGIAKWAIERKQADSRTVEAAIAGLYGSGQAVTKQSVAQVLDGVRGTRKRDAYVPGWQRRLEANLADMTAPAPAIEATPGDDAANLFSIGE